MRALILSALLISAGELAVVVDGQSLSEGLSTGSALSTTQTRGNRMASGLNFLAGDGFRMRCGDNTCAPFVDLIESQSIESPRSGLANYYFDVTGTPLTVLTKSQGGSTYAQLKTGTNAWTWLLNSVESFGARHTGERVVATYVVHGESDHQVGTSGATYKANLLEWQQDIQAKARASTESGATAIIPLYLDQMSSWSSSLLGGSNATTIPLAQYQAARENPGVVILIGPKYQYPYSDGVHLTAASSRRMGATAGKVIAYGPTWEPVWPSTESPAQVTLSGAVITIPFHVPTPPLVLDTTTVSNPGNYGFTYTCGSSPPAISSVALSGDTSVAITLASTPSAQCQTDDVIRYALTVNANTNGGPTTGARGNVRDSASATFEGLALYNFAVHFEESVQ